MTVTVGPDGQNNWATVTDLTTGTTVPLNPELIQVKGPVVRLLISANQLPPKGFALNNYQFAVYSQLSLNADFAVDRQLRAGRLDDPNRSRDEHQPAKALTGRL